MHHTVDLITVVAVRPKTPAYTLSARAGRSGRTGGGRARDVAEGVDAFAQARGK